MQAFKILFVTKPASAYALILSQETSYSGNWLLKHKFPCIYFNFQEETSFSTWNSMVVEGVCWIVSRMHTTKVRFTSPISSAAEMLFTTVHVWDLIFVFQFRHHFKRVTRNLRKPELVSLPPNDKLCFLGAIIPSHSLYQEQKKKQRIISTELYNQNYAWSSELPQIKKRHNLYEHQTVITPFQIFWISQCMANPPPHIWLEVFHFTILILFFNGKIISLRKSRLLNGNEHLLSV